MSQLNKRSYDFWDSDEFEDQSDSKSSSIGSKSPYSELGSDTSQSSLTVSIRFENPIYNPVYDSEDERIALKKLYEYEALKASAEIERELEMKALSYEDEWKANFKSNKMKYFDFDLYCREIEREGWPRWPKRFGPFRNIQKEYNRRPLPYHDLHNVMSLVRHGLLLSLRHEITSKNLDPFNVKWHEEQMYMPLDMAASKGHFDIVKYLVLSFPKSWKHWSSAQLEAAKNGHIHIVLYIAWELHFRRVVVSGRKPFQEREILSILIEGGNTKVVAHFMDQLPNDAGNTAFDNGDYPIGIVAQNGDSQMAFHLLYGRIAPLLSMNSYDFTGYQPTHIATDNGNDVVLEMLLNAGAEFDNPIRKVINSNNTPLHCAAWNDSVKCCKLLIDKGADMSKRNINGDTPLHLAVHERSLRAVVYLKRRGSNLNIKNNYGETPRDLAVKMLGECPDDHVWQHICDFFNDVDESCININRRFPNLSECV